MHTVLHPEYPAYLRDWDTFRRCCSALRDWEASCSPIFIQKFSLRWTPQGARQLARSLSQFIQAYNRVLWDSFPYCRRCMGQCCGVNAATVELFDLLALSLLNLSLPVLPERIDADERDCIYHTSSGCSWPAEWRTQKCWLFYCIGKQELEQSDQESLPSVGERYAAIAHELTNKVAPLLPAPFRRYERIRACRFSDYFDRPLSLSKLFTQALLHIFLYQFNLNYPLVDQEQLLLEQPGADCALESWDACVRDEKQLEAIEIAIQEAMRLLPTISQDPNNPLETISDDLETLEWIVLGQPQNSATLLDELSCRYQLSSNWIAQQNYPFYERIYNLVLAIQKALLTHARCKK